MTDNELYKNLPNKLSQLLAFFNSTSDSIIICDKDFTISYVNPVFEKLTGYKAKNVLGKSYKMIDADTNYDASNKSLWVALTKGKTYQLTSHNKKQNGEYYWIENNIMPVTNENERGNITHLIFIGKNITEQTKTLNTLTKSERALEEAGKIAKLGYYILDIKQDFWTSSTELNNIFGIKKDGKKTLGTWVQLIHPDDKESMLNYFTNEVLTKKKKFDIEYKIINQKTGQVKWVHGLGSLTFDENRNPVKMFGTIQDITERKHIEQALIESEEKFRSIFHSQKSGIILVIDEKGKILEWNKGAEIAFGYSEKEMQKKTLTDLMPKRYREKHQQGLEHAFKSRTLSNLGNTFELFGLRKNEEEFPIELTLGSWESNGKLFFSAIIFDISKRKETEKRLFHADTIIQEIGSIVLLSDCNGQLIFCSPSIKNLTGYTSKEVKGNKWWEVSFVNKEDSDFAKKRLIDYSKNKNKINTELHQRQVKCKDGTVKWFEWHNTRGVDDNIISMGYDITARILAEQEVNKLSRAINQSPVSVMITDLDGNIEYVNPNFENVTGYSMAEVIGKTPNILKPKNADSKIYDELWETICAGKTWKGEFKNVKKDGTLFWERASVGPILDKKGKIISFLALKEDITEKKATEKQLKFTLSNLESLVQARTEQLEHARNELQLSLNKEKELGELKSRFVATASHQFRTPLTVIQANIGLINMQIDTLENGFKDKLNRVTTRIQSEVERMTELMNDVLILGKINAGSVKPIFKPINLLTIINETSRKYNGIQSDGRKIIVKIDGKARTIVADDKLMEHTISNLLSNAFKYSIGHQSPTLTVGFENNQVKISVKDFGIGIPPDEVKNLFQTFYRATNANDFPGTGLGIAIAKEYAELNGGEISVTSKLNEGSEFIIVFKNK